MANPNIFQAYLRPPKSVAEYTAEMDKGEADRLSLADARRTSAEKDRQIMEANAFRAALAGTDPTTPEGMNKLRSISPTAAMSLQEKIQKMASDKSSAKLNESRATNFDQQTAKSKDEMAQQEQNRRVAEFASLPNPQAALADLEAKERAGVVPPDKAAQLRQELASIQTPEQFRQFKLQKMAERLLPKDLIELMTPKALPAVNTGAQQVIPMQNRMDGTITQGATFNRTVSPDAQLQANTSTANAQLQAGTTIRGQDLSADTQRRGQDLQATKDKSLTDAQSKAVLFGTRMLMAHNILGDLEDLGTTTGVPGARAKFGVGASLNVALPENQQKLNQAKRDFVNAVLRRESGAVITDPEFANAEQQYFPQIGDEPGTILQKANARKVAMRGILAEVPESKRKQLIGEISGQKVMSESDVSEAMKQSKKTREEVIRAARSRGYVIH